MQMGNAHATHTNRKNAVVTMSNDTPLPSFAGKSVVNIAEIDYKISSKPLGSGGYGTVYRGKDSAGKYYAIKVMKLGYGEFIAARSELGVYELLRDLCGVNEAGYQMFPCLRAVEVFQRKIVVMVMDLIVGESLLDWFSGKQHQKMTDEQVVKLLWLIMEPVKQMHMVGISHNDLKLDNMIPRFNLQTHEPLVVTIFDFGLSCTDKASRKDSGTCHTQFASDQVNFTMDPNYHVGITNRFQADVHAVGHIMQFIFKEHLVADSHINKILTALIASMIKPQATSRPTIRRAQAVVQRLMFASGDIIRINQQVYTIQKYLSSGTYGALFQVAREDRIFALKIQSNRGIVGGAAGRELAIMQALPPEVCAGGYVVCLEDWEVDLLSGETFMVMPYYALGDLSQYMTQHPPKEARVVLKWVCAIVRAVWELHEIGTASLDIKLNNFVVVREGMQPKAAIIDLGLACSTGLQRDQPALCRLKYPGKGKQAHPKHIAPELYKSGAQNIFSADIYSLGYAIRRILAHSVHVQRLHASGSKSAPLRKSKRKRKFRTESFITAIQDKHAFEVLANQTKVSNKNYAEADTKDRQKEIHPSDFPSKDRRVFVAIHTLSRIMRATNFRIRPNIARIVHMLREICTEFKEEDVCFILPDEDFAF
jgi:serine/threonine protein kinase